MGFIENAKKERENLYQDQGQEKAPLNSIEIPAEARKEQQNIEPKKSAEIPKSASIDSVREVQTGPQPNFYDRNTYQKTIKTYFDEIIDYLKSSGKALRLRILAKSIGISNKRCEKLLKILEDADVVEMNYPLNLISDPRVNLLKEFKRKEPVPLPPKRELTDNYEIDLDNIKARVNIWSSPKEDVPLYELILPEVEMPTEIFIDFIVDKIAKETDIDESILKDQEKNKIFRSELLKKARESILEYLHNLKDEEINYLAAMVVHDMYGLGKMEIMMADNWLEEIAINGSKVPVSVYHKRLGWTRTTIFLENEEEIYNFAAQIGRKVGRQINSLSPMMDAHLISGDRVAATLSPISTLGNTITIRRFSRNPWTMIHLIDPEIKTMSPEIAALLWLCVQYELNIMVAGGTASGKTSVLNSICSLIPATQRILSIEDTRELSLPEALHWNWIPMSSRKANPEGQGGVSMLDLMVESLRMRPDRIIVGEVRRKEQAETMFETMHTGHSVYSTMHADTVEQLESRLIDPPIEIPKTEIGALQLIIVQYRDRRKGARRTLEVAEILSQEGDDNTLALNYLFKWKPRTDTFEKINSSIRIMEVLNLHTGMTHSEIEKDLETKENILLWMSRHNLKDVDKVGRVMKIYYKNPGMIIQAAERDVNPNEIIE